MRAHNLALGSVLFCGTMIAGTIKDNRVGHETSHVDFEQRWSYAGGNLCTPNVCGFMVSNRQPNGRLWVIRDRTPIPTGD